MAYQLKTTGIAANCTMCIAVDPDTGTIKDFASAGVTADMTVGANVTTGTRTWDGNSRHYFRLGAGTAAADFVAFGTTKPSYTNNVAGTQRTVVWIGEAAGAQARVIGKDSSNYLASQDTGSGGATFPRLFGMGYAGAVTGGGAAISAGAKRIFGISMIHGTSGITYAAADTDSAMTAVSVGAPTATSTTANFDVAYVGRRNDATAHQQDYVHAVLIFNTALTEAQWDSLRDDWFTVLLEPAAGGTFAVTNAGGIASGEAFGAAVASFVGPFAVTGAGGIASGEAFGTAALSFVVGGTLNFQADGLEFGARTGLGIDTFALDAGESYRYTVHADGLTLGAALLTSAAITLDGAGKLPDLTSASLTPGTTYRVVAVRQADGEAATFRMVAA